MKFYHFPHQSNKDRIGSDEKFIGTVRIEKLENSPESSHLRAASGDVTPPQREPRNETCTSCGYSGRNILVVGSRSGKGQSILNFLMEKKQLSGREMQKLLGWANEALSITNGLNNFSQSKTIRQLCPSSATQPHQT